MFWGSMRMPCRVSSTMCYSYVLLAYSLAMAAASSASIVPFGCTAVKFM